MALTNAHHEGQRRLHLAAPRRRDDRDRVGHRDRRPATPRTRRARSRSTRPATRRPRTSTGPRSSRAASRSGCAAARSATTSSSSRRSGSAAGRARTRGDLIHTRRRDGGRASCSTARTRAASAATSVWRRCDAATMVGVWGMAPARSTCSSATFDGETNERDARADRASGFEAIGMRLMNRTRGSADFQADPVAPSSAIRSRRSSPPSSSARRS